MATTTSGFWYPDEGTAFNINTIIATTVSSLETKIGPHVLDTGWVEVTLKSGYTGSPMVRRIGKTVYFKGRVERTSWSTGLHAVGTVPVGFRPLSYFDSSSPMWPNPSLLGAVFGSVTPAGAFEIRVPSGIGAVTQVFMKGLSGYTID